MLVHLFGYSIDNGILFWFGVPITLIVIFALYSQLRKRRSTEN